MSGPPRHRLITLLSDFGLDDPYVGIMKGVVLSITGVEGVTLVDLTHRVPPQDVTAGMLKLKAAVPWFPPGTIHLAVVDPGVGSTRRPLVVSAAGHFFVGPDNGLFTPYVQTPGARAHLLANPALRLPQVSRTFHGRDVFAPAAAWLARGKEPEQFGPEVLEPTVLELEPVLRLEGRLVGRVMLSDVFGNLVTNLTEEDLRSLSPDLGHLRIHCAGANFLGCVPTYGSAAGGELVAVVGSNGHLELAVNGGSARERLGAEVGEVVTVMGT